MIRVSGILKGRRFDVVGDGGSSYYGIGSGSHLFFTRGMQGLTGTDLYAGSGSLGLEAGVEGPARSFLSKRISEQLNSSRIVLLYSGVTN